jgi:hypothetical protein
LAIFVASFKDGEEVDNNFEDFTRCAAVLYLRIHLEQNPGLNELVVKKQDDTIAMELSNGAKQEMKQRDNEAKEK